MHTLEHIGLGRYGDQLDPDGWSKALASLARLLQPQGYLLLSVPIGIQRVQFNAHRIFHPTTVLKASFESFVSFEFYYLSESGIFVRVILVNLIIYLPVGYNFLAVFCFVKN